MQRQAGQRGKCTAGFITFMMAACALAAVACGSDGGSGPAPVSSGITPSKPVGTLTATEVTQLCKTVEDAFKDPAVSEGVCKFTAVFGAVAATLLLPNATDAQLQMACTMGYSECKKPSSQTTTNECKPANATCTATVGEVEKCLFDMKGSLANLGASVPACAALTKATLSNALSGAGDLTKEPASCKTVDQKCPGLVPEPGLPN